MTADQSRPVPRASESERRVRDALLDVLHDLAHEAHYTGERDSWAVYLPPYADRILALVRPVEGIVLTPEEAATALRAVEEFRDGAEISRKDSNLMHALAARLEARA